jgi:hypothetical protein
MQSVPITTKVVSLNPAQVRCTQYNIMWIFSEIPTNDLRSMNMNDLEYGINQVKDSKELMAGSLQHPLLYW